MKSRRELESYLGNPSQISYIHELTYTEGRMRGARLWEVRAGNCLTFGLLPDKCLDIGQLSYKGVNIGWQGKGGFYSAPYAHPALGEFNRYFGGGMLWTCGLKNTGDDHISADGYFAHAHGRIGITPCEQVWKECRFEGDDYVLRAGAVVRESSLGAHNLTLTRRVTTTLNKAEIDVSDTLENHEPAAEDYLILYHYNFGYPFIDENLRMDFGKQALPIIPRTDEAEKGLGEWDRFGKPTDGYEEQCFFHDPAPDADGMCKIRLENPALGLGVQLSYDKSTLPILTQWKSLRSGEYVLGVEPGNSYLRGIDAEREAGNIGQIEAFGSLTFHTKLNFYDMIQ